jgi:hypothetical protein
MKGLLSTIAFVFLAIAGSAQNPNKLSFEFGGGVNTFAMRQFNQHYVDSFALDLGWLDNGINYGFNGQGSVRFQPTGLFDVGVYGNFQLGKSSGSPHFVTTNEWGLPIDTVYGTNTVTAQSVGVGVSNSWFLSHVLKFHEKESGFLQRFRIAIELNTGVAFSTLIQDAQFELEEFNFPSNYNRLTSTDFQGLVALKLEYDYLKSPMIGTIGLKLGYQYLRTATLQDRTGKEWRVLDEQPIHLDFSGFIGSVYLAFGK